MTAAVLLAILCCSRPAATRSAVVAGVELPPGFVLSQSEERSLVGASGLTVDRAGKLWAVPEDSRSLLALSVAARTLRVEGRPLRIEGIDAGLDIESIAAIDPGHFVLGSEARGVREADRLFWVEVEGRRARVTRAIELEYRWWGIRAEDNQGIEGLCHADGRLVAALEPVIKKGGKRYAPIGSFDMDSGRWRAMRLRLTTDAGKIAALSCRARPEGEIAVTAVERHYGIARVLWFSLPDPGSPAAGSASGELLPEVLLDLGPLLRPLPNFEGIARLGDELFIISDNFQRSTTGPTYMVRFSAPPADKKPGSARNSAATEPTKPKAENRP